MILPLDFDTALVQDSKKLTARQRERALERVQEEALAIAVSVVDPAEIDQLNIHHAGLAAMRRAIDQLDPACGHALVDGHHIPGLGCSQTRIVGGDACEASIAAASIVAKVTRDALMVSLDEVYPAYGFAGHKGYPTARHREALERWGPSPVHRMSYPAVQALVGNFSPRFESLMTAAEAVKTSDDLQRWRGEVSAPRKVLSEPELKRLRSFMTRKLARAPLS